MHMRKPKSTAMLAVVVAAVSTGPGVAVAQNARGSAEGPTKARGYDHPDQFIHLKDVKLVDNMYPVIQHPEQEQQARAKLAALASHTGRKPNILIFLLRSEEHTSELQSHVNLVCRLLLEK